MIQLLKNKKKQDSVEQIALQMLSELALLYGKETDTVQKYKRKLEEQGVKIPVTLFMHEVGKGLF